MIDIDRESVGTSVPKSIKQRSLKPVVAAFRSSTKRSWDECQCAMLWSADGGGDKIEKLSLICSE